MFIEFKYIKEFAILKSDNYVSGRMHYRYIHLKM